MQLTRLELKGFKSFADKVTINFDEGITGIVGPNGCGKSNVVDAIRWVLGETKTRVLRSEKMENIIFNGTKKRKPTQLAEVSLTFDNTKNLIPTEYSQVTITRKYFRSGDSEYMLNGVACRRKDITNLFLDTGIASNSYAIIELKMVDDLLNDKDNSRRSLFEEAAGIAKFKIRKKETLKKLEDTDADLDRVEDLLFEIDKNLKSLERQARQAKRFYEIKDEYKTSSILLARKTASTQLEIQSNIEKEIAENTDRREALTTEMAAKEAQLEILKKNLVERENLLSSRQKALNDHVNNIRQYESDKKIKNERKRFLDDRVESLKEQIKHDKESNERASFAIKSLEKSRSEAEKELKEVEGSLEKLREAYEAQKEQTENAQKELNQLNSAFAEQRENVFRHTKDIEIKNIQLGTLQSELEKTGKDSSEHSINLDQFNKKIEELRADKLKKQKEFERLKLSQDKTDSKISELTEQLEAQREELSQINRKLDSSQNEFNLTKSMVDSLEGFPEAIRFLKQSPDWKETSLVSDILSCPEEYRICIENYLEQALSYFIVNNRQEALDATRVLKEAGHGKANFFILDELNGVTPKSSTAPENCVSALELTEYDPEYQSVLQHLLGNVFIYEGTAPSHQEEDIILLDKSGSLTLRKYSISGGSVGLFEGKRIGRAKNLEKLGKEIKTLSEKQVKVQRSLQKLTETLDETKKDVKTLDLENIREEISGINESLASFQSKRDQFNEMISSSANRQVDIKTQIEELKEELKQLNPGLESEKKSLSEIEEQVAQRRGSMDELNADLEKKSQSYNGANVLFHQKQNKLNAVQQEITFKEESFNQSKARIESNSELLHQTEKDLNELAKKSVENDDELIKMYDEKESIEGGVNEAEKEYYTTRGAIDSEEKEIRELQRKRESIDQILMQWSGKLNEVKLSLTSVKERLSVEFNIDFDKIDQEEINEKHKDLSEEELTEKVSKLKNRMESMGPINPMAMEAFDEIKERHDFISGQKEDLLKAKDSLLTTISEIDTVAKDTFMDAFDKIKENFIQVFRTLFTEEDDCDLYLTDPDNPLESPIEITAKPKGKRPLTINQLSGGEKTLTATSLLFAIYLLKPAPFCIFDEVDAPLDDANIDKFNQIIRQFSKDSQFIIVTHNKRTMASTDIVYGITMIEQGISRVVPVDLRELV